MDRFTDTAELQIDRFRRIIILTRSLADINADPDSRRALEEIRAIAGEGSQQPLEFICPMCKALRMAP